MEGYGKSNKLANGYLFMSGSILWTVVFGIFGKLFIHKDSHGDGNFQRNKNAVWVDLINMLLWFVTAIIGGIMFFRNRGRKSLHTGRATV